MCWAVNTDFWQVSGVVGQADPAFFGSADVDENAFVIVFFIAFCYFVGSGRCVWRVCPKVGRHRLSQISGLELDVTREVADLICNGSDVSGLRGLLRCHGFSEAWRAMAVAVLAV